MTTRIAAEEPHWEPGTAAGYHAILWGYLAGELALRTVGKSLGQLLRERIAGPLDADFHIGLPVSEHARVADLIGPNHARVQPDPATLLGAKVPPLFKFALQNPSVRPWQDACSADLAQRRNRRCKRPGQRPRHRAHLRRSWLMASACCGAKPSPR